MVTMAQSAPNWRNMHVHSRGSHTFTRTLYTNTVTAMWCEAPAQPDVLTSTSDRQESFQPGQRVPQHVPLQELNTHPRLIN